MILPSGSTVVNVETVTINTSGTGMTADVTGYTGLTNFTTQVGGNAGATTVTAESTTALTVAGATDTGAAGTADVTIIGGGGVLSITASKAAAANDVTVGGTAVANAFTSASIVGGAIVAITDKSGASATTGSTLKTVTITGAVGDQTLTGNGITTVNLTNLIGATTVGDTTVTAAAATRALTVNFSGVDVAGDAANTGTDVLTLTDATATSLTINAVTKASFDAGVVAGAATAVVIASAVALELQTLTAGVAKTVGISGAGKTTITVDTFASDVVITSTSAGGVILTQALTANQQFVGSASSGADNISLATSYTKAVTTGAGNDTVIIAGAFATGGSVDAGDGTADVLSLTTTLAANDSLSASTTFGGLISNFEVLSLSTSVAKTINMANLDSVASVIYAVGATEAQTLDNFANNGSIEFKAASDGSAATTIVVAGASLAGRNSDAISVILGAATSGAGAAFDTLTIANVETVNIASSRTGTIVAADTNTLGLVADNAVNIVVTGNVDVNLTAALAGAALQTIDGTANTNGLTASTAGAAQGIVIKGSLTAANTLTGGAGGDLITGGSGVDAIVGGAGADIMNGGEGADTLTGDAGNDTYNVTETTAAIDDVVFEAAATNGVDTVNGFAAGAGIDTVSLSKANTESQTGATANDVLTFATEAVALVTGGAAYVLASATATKSIIEITTTLDNAVTLSSTSTGADLLQALSSDTTAAGSITVGTDLDIGFLVVYQNSNAYLFHYVDSATAGVATLAADIRLIGVFNGITAGDFASGDFIAL